MIKGVNMRFLMSFFLLSFLSVSCGEDNTDNDNNTVPPQEETAPSEQIRWSRVELHSQDGFIDFYDHSLSVDLNRRPVIVDGSFKDEKSCSFSITLTEGQADRLEREADDLDTCTEENDDGDVIIEGATNTITLTDRNRNVTEAYKNKYRDFDVTQTWLCKGKSSFYSYLKDVVQDKLPDGCPSGALEKF
jgi:hypothetical protein